jgi:hypothetical protein
MSRSYDEKRTSLFASMSKSFMLRCAKMSEIYAANVNLLRLCILKMAVSWIVAPCSLVEVYCRRENLKSYSVCVLNGTPVFRPEGTKAIDHSFLTRAVVLSGMSP